MILKSCSGFSDLKELMKILLSIPIFMT